MYIESNFLLYTLSYDTTHNKFIFVNYIYCILSIDLSARIVLLENSNGVISTPI